MHNQVAWCERVEVASSWPEAALAVHAHMWQGQWVVAGWIVLDWQDVCTAAETAGMLCLVELFI